MFLLLKIKAFYIKNALPHFSFSHFLDFIFKSLY